MHIQRLQNRYDLVQSGHVLRSLFLNKLCLEIQTGPHLFTHVKYVFGYALQVSTAEHLQIIGRGLISKE